MNTRIWAVGDMKPRPEAYNIANLIESDKTTQRFVYLGDVYDNGSVEDYAERYEPVFGKIKYMTRPIPGNHDWHSHLIGYKAYWENRPPFYSKDYGGWKLLFVDTNIPMASGSPQYEWAKSCSQTWKDPVVVCHHHHRYSAGGHGDQPQVQPILDLFQNRLCVGLSGHTHNMQLFNKINNYTQIVIGCGGKEMYPVDFSDKRLSWGSNDFGAIRLDLSPGKIDLDFFRHDGTHLHSSVVQNTNILMI